VLWKEYEKQAQGNVSQRRTQNQQNKQWVLDKYQEDYSRLAQITQTSNKGQQNIKHQWESIVRFPRYQPSLEDPRDEMEKVHKKSDEFDVDKL